MPLPRHLIRSLGLLAMVAAAAGLSGTAGAGEIDTAHAALRDVATWTVCIERKVIDADQSAARVQDAAIRRIDALFLRRTGHRALDLTPLDDQAYRTLATRLVDRASGDDRRDLCAAAKSRAEDLIRKAGGQPARPRVWL